MVRNRYLTLTVRLLINILDTTIVDGYVEVLHGRRELISIPDLEKQQILEYLKSLNNNINDLNGIILEQYHTMLYARQKFRSSLFKYV